MKLIRWIVRQLFGASIGDALTKELQARVASLIQTQAAATEDQAVSLIMPQIGDVAAQIAGRFPGWARAAVIEMVQSGAESLIRATYRKITGGS
jgi:hypothetical protein